MLRLPWKSKQKGDTLIEVLFAFTILSLVIIGALSIMNQGTIASQRSLETTLVRQQIDSQATTLRFLHDAYVAAYQTNGTYADNTPAKEWQTMANSLSLTATTASAFNTGATTCPSASSLPALAFILDVSQAKYVKGSTTTLIPATTYAQVQYNASDVFTQSEGIWIEGIRSTATSNVTADNARFIDFHIRACWLNPGQGPVMTIATIVRLYEPRG